VASIPEHFSVESPNQIPKNRPFINYRPPCAYFTATYLARSPVTSCCSISTSRLCPGDSFHFPLAPSPCRLILRPTVVLVILHPNPMSIELSVYETNFLYALGGDISRTGFSFPPMKAMGCISLRINLLLWIGLDWIGYDTRETRLGGLSLLQTNPKSPLSQSHSPPLYTIHNTPSESRSVSNLFQLRVDICGSTAPQGHS
jgi:hypothetical protein